MMTATLREPMTVYPMKRDLTSEICAASIETLNQCLADAIDLQLQAKQAHWNVKGPSFLALHGLFERVALDLARHADLLAERAVQLGGLAEGLVLVIAERSDLPRYPLRITAGVDHVRAVAGALSAFGSKMQPRITEAEQAGDPVTADILTEVSRDIDKLLWLVEAHAETPR
jgi:starvation-inducible DNA-binding protein